MTLSCGEHTILYSENESGNEGVGNLRRCLSIISAIFEFLTAVLKMQVMLGVMLCLSVIIN